MHNDVIYNGVMHIPPYHSGDFGDSHTGLIESNPALCFGEPGVQSGQSESLSPLIQIPNRRERPEIDRCGIHTSGILSPRTSTILVDIDRFGSLSRGTPVIITSKSDYGLRAALYLATRDERVRLREISETQHIPAAVCSHVMRKLVAAEIVKSVAGPAGGYTLAREAAQISVASVLSAADRDICIFRCVEDGPEPGLPGCDCDLNGKCAFQAVLKGFGASIAEYLENLSLADLKDSQSGIPGQSAQLPEFNIPAMANGKAS